MNDSIPISVIIPISERYDNVRDLYFEYKRALDAGSASYEFIYALDGEFPEPFRQLKSLQAEREPITIVTLPKKFGEAAAIMAAFERSVGESILVLPAYYQVEPSEIRRVIEALQGCDVVIGRRAPRKDAWANRLQAQLFRWMLGGITGGSFHDLGCAVRGLKRIVLEEVSLYGDQHRFLPVLARARGFRVREIGLAQAVQDQRLRLYPPGVYIRRMLDILTVFFLVRFTKKPLRFFGLIGAVAMVIGAILLMDGVFDRFVLGVPLADRPVLLLSSLLMVVGVQSVALGLIGELIIFTHASELKEYTIEKIVDSESAGLEHELSSDRRKDFA